MDGLEKIKVEFYKNPNYDEKLFYNTYIKELEKKVVELDNKLIVTQLSNEFALIKNR